MTSVFGLNRSYTKRIEIGLEINSGTYVPVIRVLAKDRAGIKFGEQTWAIFTAQFPTISRHFQEEREAALDKCEKYGDIT